MSNKAAMFAIRRWTTEELVDVLKQNGLEKVCKKIKKKSIDGSRFVDMKFFNISKLKVSKKTTAKLLCFITDINSNPEKFVKITDDKPSPTQQTPTYNIKDNIQFRNLPTCPSQNPNPNFNPTSNGNNCAQYLKMSPSALSNSKKINSIAPLNAYPSTQNTNVTRQISQNSNSARRNSNNTNQQDPSNISDLSNTYPGSCNANFNDEVLLLDEALHEEQHIFDYEISTPIVSDQKIEKEEKAVYEAEPMIVQELEMYLIPSPPIKKKLKESSTDGNVKINDRPLPTIPIPINLHQGIVNNPWFKQVSRSEAEIMVLNKPTGAFLFRPSTQPGSECTLTLIYNNCPFHISVQKRRNRRYALGAEKTDEDTFPSLFDLVESYEKKGITLFRKKVQIGSVRLVRNVV